MSAKKTPELKYLSGPNNPLYVAAEEMHSGETTMQQMGRTLCRLAPAKPGPILDLGLMLLQTSPIDRIDVSTMGFVMDGLVSWISVQNPSDEDISAVLDDLAIVMPESKGGRFAYSGPLPRDAWAKRALGTIRDDTVSAQTKDACRRIIKADSPLIDA